MNLEQALEPIALQEFIDEILGQRHLLVTRRPGRFACVVEWDEINRTLDLGRFTEDRLRLFQQGKPVSPSAYLAPGGEEAHGRCVHARNMERLLSGGASLVLNKVDELFPSVRALAESCEEHLRIPIGVNLYAGWRTDKAFDLHWDSHDTLILQACGRKRWSVYEPTLLHPLLDTPGAVAPKPAKPPVWEGVLEDGDLLYMPRGWWHMAVPLDEPTLHLTFGWQHRTGADLLKWVTNELRKHVEIRSDLPHLSSPAHQAAYMARLRELVASALTDDAAERFMRVVDRGIPARARTFLPAMAVSKPRTLSGDSRMHLTTGHRLYFDADTDTDGRRLRFLVGETPWTCDAAMLPALSLLRQTRATTLREMLAVVESAQRLSLQALVSALIAGDALWVEPSASTAASTASTALTVSVASTTSISPTASSATATAVGFA